MTCMDFNIMKKVAAGQQGWSIVLAAASTVILHCYTIDFMYNM